MPFKDRLSAMDKNIKLLYQNKKYKNRQTNMSEAYFKFRGRFDFSPHRYDLGRPIFQNRVLGDNFLLLKIYGIDESENSPFYQYQLDHFLTSYPLQEEAFFKHVHDVVINRIKHFKRLDPFSSKYAAGLENTRKLDAFLGYLKSIDRWHKTNPHLAYSLNKHYFDNQ
ncbi:MAG: hypothetical protein NVSMB24_04850 [Mucilaginibacter sp.]